MVMQRYCLASLAIGAALLSGGCATTQAMRWHDDRPPAGYVHASGYETSTLPVVRYKGAHQRGLKVHTFENPKGGTLAYWTRDLVEKLQERGYKLDSQSAITSANEVNGARLDFTYTPVAHEGEPVPESSYYTALLFVSDEYRVVLQLAGPVEQANAGRSEAANLLSGLEIGGCKRRKSICREAATSNSSK